MKELKIIFKELEMPLKDEVASVLNPLVNDVYTHYPHNQVQLNALSDAIMKFYSPMYACLIMRCVKKEASSRFRFKYMPPPIRGVILVKGLKDYIS